MTILMIDGGNQKTMKGMINTGIQRELSLQAMFALVCASSIGLWRPQSLRCGNVAYNAYLDLLANIFRKQRDEDPEKVISVSEDYPTFADIKVLLDKDVPDGEIWAMEEIRTVSGGKNKPRVMGKLKGIVPCQA